MIGRLGLFIGMGAPSLPAGVITNPTQLTLTGYYRGNYTGSPWAGTASAGTSGSHSIAAGTTPSTGVALNGITPALFVAASSQSLRDLTFTMEAYVSTTAYTISCLIKPVTAQAHGANPFNNPSIFGENGGNIGLEYSDSGAQLFHLTGGIYKIVTVALPTGSWALVDSKYDGVNIQIRVNGGAWQSLAAGSLTDPTGLAIRVGMNFNATAFLDSNVMEILVSNTAISDANLAVYKSYINTTYGLAL
jgi:hypothetical protein